MKPIFINLTTVQGVEQRVNINAIAYYYKSKKNEENTFVQFLDEADCTTFIQSTDQIDHLINQAK